jgi:Histidine acid phosphatase.
MKQSFKGFFSAILLLSVTFLSFAQTGREKAFSPYSRIGGIYHSYESDSVSNYRRTPAPEGYKPFYISHFGRHGSRWLASEPEYSKVHDLMKKAYDDVVLTPLGIKLLGQLDTVCADAEGRWGELSPRGVEEQKGVARRMYQSFPEVFSDGAHVQSRSTTVFRTILSMAAFDEGLKEMNPKLDITRETGERFQKYLSNFGNMNRQSRLIEHISDSLARLSINPDRLLGSLIFDPAWIAANIESPRSAVSGLYRIASDMEDVDYLGISLYQYFTEDELYACYDHDNVRMFLYCGPSVLNASAAMKDEIPLLTNIIETADRVISDGSQAATLRFGHDTNITPLELLMGIQDCGISTSVTDLSKVSDSWQVSVVSPMCANVQIIFYHRTDCANCGKDDVLVKILRNEQEATLPIESAMWPYYRWSDVRTFWMDRMDGVR